MAFQLKIIPWYLYRYSSLLQSSYIKQDLAMLVEGMLILGDLIWYLLGELQSITIDCAYCYY